MNEVVIVNIACGVALGALLYNVLLYVAAVIFGIGAGAWEYFGGWKL